MCCVKYWKVSCCIFLQFWRTVLWTSSIRPKKPSIGLGTWDVRRTSGLESHTVDVLKTSQKDVHRVTFLGRPEDVNFELLAQMHLHCINFNLTSPNVCLKHQRVSCFIILRFAGKSQRHPLNVTKWRREGDVHETSPEHYAFLW